MSDEITASFLHYLYGLHQDLLDFVIIDIFAQLPHDKSYPFTGRFLELANCVQNLIYIIDISNSNLVLTL